MVKVLRESWNETVYKPSRHKEIDPAVRALVRELAGGKCQVMGCGAQYKLEVHHVMPRADGGQDNVENLILLCRTHHDRVEVEGIRNRELIINYVDEDEGNTATGHTPEDVGDWRTWVYGGRRPGQRRK